MEPDDIAVVELSSFQLMGMTRSADVAVVTNLAPNHLDVHKDMAEYIAAKQNVYLHQSKTSKLVVNMDNAITDGFAESRSWYSREVLPPWPPGTRRVAERRHHLPQRYPHYEG